MTIRHEALLAARAVSFTGCVATDAWRIANRNYVAARDALKTPKINMDAPASELDLRRAS
jgi:hypothetical protein